MKRIVKVTIILMVIFTTFAQINCVYAGKQTELEELQQQEKQQKEQGYNTKWSEKSTDWWKPINEDVGEEELKSRADIVVTVIRNVGIVVSVVALMIIGIREMTAGAEEKSIIKQSMPGYILGIIMVVAVTALPSIIYGLTKNL